MIFLFFQSNHLAVFIWFDDILKRKFYQICKKGFCPKQGKSLKNYAILEVSCKPGGTISSARKHVFEKKCCKSVAKTVVQKVSSPETRINTGFFGTSKPRGTTPTPKCKTDINCFCLGVLTWCALIWYRLSQFYEVFLLLLLNSRLLDAITTKSI